MPEPDLALLDRWCAGEATAGNELFNRHFTTLYRFFENKIIGEVDDLVQETLLECVRSRDAFKRQSTFRTYLFAIARHVLFQHWRRRSATRPTIDFDEISVESLSTSVGSRLAKQSDRARLLSVLRTLPLEQQLLLEMFYWQDCDRDELAQIFEVEPATIGSRLHR
ncbi:MAG: sigma-70 family RNA polymerase sigma factor, partial [Kofleriaceae bacterium]